MQNSLFENVEELPRDPILGITEAFVADKDPRRVNLGVGVYQDENGKVPLLACVKQAEEQLLAKAAPHSYAPIDGLAGYNSAVAQMVFADKADLANVVTVQALGGTGALKLGAELLRVVSPQAKVWISDPSWENHRALFSAAGFTVETYPYYGADGELDFAGMTAALEKIPAGDIVLLHACCHNPTGLDLSQDQWRKVAAIVRARGVTPFLDTAYMGFAEGPEADAFSVRLFAADGGPLLVSFSFSKSLSLYGERVGALCVLTASAKERGRVLSQLKRIARVTYSSPASHGAAAAALVLADPTLRKQWDEELGRHACPHQADARPAGFKAGRAPAGPRFFLHHPAERHVFLFAPDRAAGHCAARKIFGLCAGQRPHLRRGAEHEKHRLCGGMRRTGHDGRLSSGGALDAPLVRRREYRTDSASSSGST